jgi:hypothetical protein
MSVMPRHPVHLNTHRLDTEVNTAMPPFRPSFYPSEITTIGWRSIGAHTVVISQLRGRYGFRMWIADERGYYARTITGEIRHASEEAALEAARQHLDSMNLLEQDA